ncbi:MAG: PEP-CTERM sorting domain-containing protein [Planctomycetales bacterium]|nr:PEP-CTERM sorting domain-containing protein [Planctomycetales bacterium]
MRTFNIQFAIVAAVVLSAGTAFSAIPDSQLTYIPFPGWDHSQVISAAGQTFTDVYGDVDVTVRQLADSGVNSSATGAGRIATGRLQKGSHSFRFTFSKPLPLVVEHQTTDLEEIFSVFTSGTETYMQLSGNPVVVSPNGSGISVAGQGFGTNAGAAVGQIIIDSAKTVTVTHQSLNDNDKFERFRFAVIPEPSSFGLTAFAMLGLLFRRKRNS